MTSDEKQLRSAFERTALHRLGVTFERAMQTEAIRKALEASARRSKPQSTPAQAACR